MIYNVLLVLTLLITVSLSFSMYYMLKYNRNFLKQIQSIRGTLLEMIEVGEEAPLFRAMDQAGRKVVATKLFKDKNTLLLFTHSECPACKGILKNLDKITNNYDLNVIVINRDKQFDDTELKKVVPNEAFYLREEFIATTYRVQSTPSVFLIENGKVKSTTVLRSENMLFNLLLNEKSKQNDKLSFTS